MPLAPAVPYNSFMTVSGTSFVDFFNFTAPVGAVQTGSAVVSIDLVPFANIDNLQVMLYTGSNASGVLVPGGAGNIGEFSQLENVGITAGTAYSFRVSGQIVGAPVGYYTFTAIAAAVPEPETYAMMLAGVAAIGFVVMRRRD